MVEDPSRTPALEFSWAGSSLYSILLSTLSIDTRVMVNFNFIGTPESRGPFNWIICRQYLRQSLLVGTWEFEQMQLCNNSKLKCGHGLNYFFLKHVIYYSPNIFYLFYFVVLNLLKGIRIFQWPFIESILFVFI